MAITSAFIMMGAFLLIGLYVAGALGVLALVLMYVFSDGPPWNIMGNKAWETNTNPFLMAVPLFLLHGRADVCAAAWASACMPPCPAGWCFCPAG